MIRQVLDLVLVSSVVSTITWRLIKYSELRLLIVVISLVLNRNNCGTEDLPFFYRMINRLSSFDSTGVTKTSAFSQWYCLIFLNHL